MISIFFRAAALYVLAMWAISPLAWAGACAQFDAFTRNLSGLDGQFTQQVLDETGQLREESSGRVALSVPRLLRWMNSRHMAQEARASLDRLHIHIPSLKVSVDSLSGGQRQAVAIARAVHWKANLVVLDEPTAALAVPEQRKVLELTRKLADEGVAVVYITHNMLDVLEVSDRIAVMYRGRKAGELETGQTSQTEIVEMIMSGRGKA